MKGKFRTATEALIRLALLAVMVGLPPRTVAQQPQGETPPAPPAEGEPALQPLSELPPQQAAQEFLPDILLLLRVAACSGDAEISSLAWSKIVEAHCQKMLPLLQRYREKYLPRVRSILDGWLPAAAPDKVVYPFGGGDLISALTTYPRARLITAISLEHAGDPRRLAGMKPADLKRNLDVFRACAAGLLRYSDSKTSSLMKLEKTGLAGLLALFAVGLAVHERRPVWVRFFRIEADGSLHYYSAEEIEELEKKRARRVRDGCSLPPPERNLCQNPDFSVAFSNVEIAFRSAGAPESEPPVIFRHIAADLSDKYITAELLAYLDQLGPVSAMTKAASYLLWRSTFSRIRRYLLGHMEVMVSDSTGIPPEMARAAGFEQETAGSFSGSFLRASEVHNRAFRKLWQTQPQRPMDFRYGYVDSAKRGHMLLTKRVEKK